MRKIFAWMFPRRPPSPFTPPLEVRDAVVIYTVYIYICIYVYLWFMSVPAASPLSPPLLTLPRPLTSHTAVVDSVQDARATRIKLIRVPPSPPPGL